MLFPAPVFIAVIMLASVIAACGTSGVAPTSPTQAVITWPFGLNDGQWAIVNGYRGNEDHALGGSPNNYALFALDFAKCLPDKVITSQGPEASCDLSSGQANTVGAAVYSPVSGTVAWSDERCFGLSIDIDGHSGFRIVLFHVDPLPGTSWSQLASNHTHFNQGDKIGTVSAGSCIGSGNHIHMALYSCTACPNSSDPASQRVGYPFSGTWSISNTPFPDDGNTSNEYLGLLVPLQHVAAPTPTPTQIPAPVPTPTQPPAPTSIPGIEQFVGTWWVGQGAITLTIQADGSATYQTRGNPQTAQIQFTSVQGNTAYGTVVGNTSIPAGGPASSIPVGGAITVTLVSPHELQVSNGLLLCPNTDQCAY